MLLSPFCFHIDSKMDTILHGLLQSNKTEREKKEIVRRIVSAGKDQHSQQEALNMFEATTRILLIAKSSFQWEAAKDVYCVWARHNKAAFRQHFNSNMLLYLLEGSFANDCNAVWIIHTSMDLVQDDRDTIYQNLCDHVQKNSIQYVKSHPEYSAVMPYCKFLLEFRVCIPQGELTALFCNAIIDAVSLFSVPSIGDPMKFINDMSHVIGGLLGHIWQKCDDECVWQCLRHVFSLIKFVDNVELSPSNALAAIVQHFPTRHIPRVLSTILHDPSVHSQHIRVALVRMISWLQWPGAQHIHLWVNGFLQQLASAKRYAMLIEVTESSVEKVCYS